MKSMILQAMNGDRPVKDSTSDWDFGILQARRARQLAADCGWLYALRTIGIEA
jgi:hypothetical protein